ncbi:hypothetical protein ACIRCZ_18740 [Leifsonia sp. NPDC102414]|uniref:hypothetical protein n=1 Tax=Leifsonia sp. NPDC102414 TaxID=3364124 RepID=UPI00381F507E
MGNKAVYLRPTLLESLRIYKRSTGLTYADILVEAFDNIDDAKLIDAFAVQPRISKSGMPVATTVQRGGEGLQINLRLNAAQVEWLSGKEEVVGAPSRSALVAKVFELFFEDRNVQLHRRD